MDAIRKTMIFLGLAAVLLCVPLAAVAEDDDVQIFPAVNSATSLSAASPVLQVRYERSWPEPL